MVALLELQDFMDAYAMAAEWSSTHTYIDRIGRELDTVYIDSLNLDWSEKAMKQAEVDCKQFIEENMEILAKLDIPSSQAGHDFWLTRNHHGAGFWDRGYDKVMAKILTDSAHKFGDINLVVGDDNLLYLE